MTPNKGPVCVSVINMKGGVGKTTIAAMLCWRAARSGRYVLAVDLDPQANLSQALMGDRRYRQFLNDRSPSIVEVTKKKRHTVSAQEYVAKMDHDPEKRPAVSELAKRFEEKTFLPTIGDIRNFCQVYGIDEPASKSRRSAIPRVFKCMATMSAEEVRGILDDGMFSGPSRLGPVADAIRESGRAAAFRDRRVKAG